MSSILEWASFVALPSISPDGKLTLPGEQETHGAKKELDLLGAPPIDHTFVAAAGNVNEAVLQAQSILLNWEISPFSEPGRYVFPLDPAEGRRLMEFIQEVGYDQGMADMGIGTDNAGFLKAYGATRHEYYRLFWGVRHALTIGYPLLIQAIASAFGLDADSRNRLRSMVITPGTIFQIDVKQGTLRTAQDIHSTRAAENSPPLASVPLD